MKKYSAALFSLAALLVSINFAPTAHGQASASGPENLLIVFDASGSMTSAFDGSTRIDVAKSTISDVVNSLDPSALVGIRALAYQNKPAKADACVNTSLIQPFTTDHSSVVSAVNSLQAVGAYTPLAYALKQAAGDFTAGQNNVLILMTDGLENCGGDPVAAAAALKAAGISVKTYVIGLNPDSSMASQLGSIAQAGGGAYYPATDAASLSTDFKTIQNLAHPVNKTNTDSLLGTSITGGNGFETAVPITPGMYHLSHYQFGSQYDYFKMDLKQGDTLNFSVQTSEAEYSYDSSTDSFRVSQAHGGDFAGMTLYSATRARLAGAGGSSNSSIYKDSYVSDSDQTVYFAIGNDSSHDNIMGMSDLITIKVSSAAAASTGDAGQANSSNSSATQQSNPDSAGQAQQTQDQNPAGTPGTASDQNNSQAIQDAYSAGKNILLTIVIIVLVAGLVVVGIIVLIVVLVVRNNKKKRLAAAQQQPVQPAAPQGALQQQAPQQNPPQQPAA